MRLLKIFAVIAAGVAAALIYKENRKTYIS